MCKAKSRILVPALAVLVGGQICYGQLALEGLVLVQEGPAANGAGDPVPDNLALGGVPFATSDLGPELGLPYHITDNLNDGSYGNEFSWIGGDDNPFPEAFAGIDLGVKPLTLQSVAFGRSNVLTGDVCGGGVCIDRHQGFYSLQYTQVPNPSNDLDMDLTNNPVNGWAEIGILEYGESDGEGTNYNNTWLRHRYNFDQVGATGIRIVVPGSGLTEGTAIDEIELYADPGEFVPPPPPPPIISLNPAEGFTIDWDGNEADFFDEVEPPDGSIVPDNAALASKGSQAFSSSDLGPQLGIDFHVVENLNDGFYGNANSWIGADDNPFAPDAFAGIALAEPLDITSIAFGRDNGNDFTDACGGQCMDRSMGSYKLQFTLVEDPDEETADTGDAATGWQDIGAIGYLRLSDEFIPYLRHEFGISDGQGGVGATGLRIVVPQTGLGGGTAIDEIEIYGVSMTADPCDVNGDGTFDVLDIDALTEGLVTAQNDPRFDVNGDGVANAADHRHLVVGKFGTWFGDANLDGEFNSSDFVGVFQAGKFETGEPATWSQGDWNADGVFSSSDFVVAFQDGGFELGPRNPIQNVPEPSSAMIIVLILSFGLLRNRINWL